MARNLAEAHRGGEEDAKRLRRAHEHDQEIGPESQPSDIGVRFSGPPLYRRADKARIKKVEPKDPDEKMPKAREWIHGGRLTFAAQGGLAKRLRLKR